MQRRKSRRGVNRTDLSLGLALREARKAKNISQEQLAFKTGYSRSYIGYLERGEKSPTLRALFELCHPLSVAPSEIVSKVEQLLIRSARR